MGSLSRLFPESRSRSPLDEARQLFLTEILIACRQGESLDVIIIDAEATACAARQIAELHRGATDAR